MNKEQMIDFIMTDCIYPPDSDRYKNLLEVLKNASIENVQALYETMKTIREKQENNMKINLNNKGYTLMELLFIVAIIFFLFPIVVCSVFIVIHFLCKLW